MALHGLIGFLVGIGLAVVVGLDVPAGTETSFVERLGAWAIVVVPSGLSLCSCSRPVAPSTQPCGTVMRTSYTP